jgi:uncharacterized membrane protein
MAKTGFTDDFRRNFLTGLAALFPIVFTLILFAWLYRQIDATVGELTVRGLSRHRTTFKAVFPDAPPEVLESPETRREYAGGRWSVRIPVVLVGVGVVIVGIYLVGKFLRGYLGRRLMGLIDRFFERFPVVKTIYPHARQVGNFLFGVSEKPRFSRVVAVQYPRQGVFSIGFATGRGLKDIGERARREMVTVFIPTSPTPLTGFIIVVPRDEVIHVAMSVEDAFRYCVTAGMLVPLRQQPELPEREPAEAQEAANLLRAALAQGHGEAQSAAQDGGRNADEIPLNPQPEGE